MADGRNGFRSLKCGVHGRIPFWVTRRRLLQSWAFREPSSLPTKAAGLMEFPESLHFYREKDRLALSIHQEQGGVILLEV